MAKLNHIRRYRFDDETNLALQKKEKKEAHEVRQCIREMLEKKRFTKANKITFLKTLKLPTRHSEVV